MLCILDENARLNEIDEAVERLYSDSLRDIVKYHIKQVSYIVHDTVKDVPEDSKVLVAKTMLSRAVVEALSDEEVENVILNGSGITVACM